MSLVPSAVEPLPVAERRYRVPGSGAQWLILSGYLLGAVALTGLLWIDPAARGTASNPHDLDFFAWFLRYDATAVAHGRLPTLVTTALNAPAGVNAMWNTSFLLPGVLLTPVTLLAGPQVTLTLMLTLGFAGSAASLFWVLRRWEASVLAAALGGAVYGFSPALVDSGLGHYNLQFAVLPPLIIHTVLLIVTGRGNAIRTGAVLGLLMAAQLCIGEELLTDTAVAALVLLAVLAASRPRIALHRVRAAATGLVTAAAVVLLICGHAMWVQFAGPLGEHSALVAPWSGDLGYFVDPPGTLLLHTAAGAAAALYFPLGPPEVLAYLGWPLLVVLPIAAIRFWPDPRVRAVAVSWAMLELLSVGGGAPVHGLGYPAALLPFHWLQGLPVLGRLLPNRFSILADGAAAALLAFSVDLARSSLPEAKGWRGRHVPAVVAVLAMLPLIPLPYHSADVPPVPAGWQAAFAGLRLAPGTAVLVVPVPDQTLTQAMRWQADTGEPGSLVGGYFLGPDAAGQPSFSPGPARWAEQYLDLLWKGRSHARGRWIARLRASLAYWRPAAVVAVTSQGSKLGRVLTGLFGPPTVQAGLVLGWRLVPASGGPPRTAATGPGRL